MIRNNCRKTKRLSERAVKGPFGLALASIALIATAQTAAAEHNPALPLGSPIPSSTVKMKNVDEKPVSIRDIAGNKGTLVVFTCNHCPYAKAWEKRVAVLANSYSNQGIGVILINANDPAAYAEDAFLEMQIRAKNLGLRVPYVVDDTSNVARDFGASVTPEAFLFAADGKLVYHGTIDDNRADPDKVTTHYLGDALAAVASGHAPKTTETKSLGCSIKFRVQPGKP
jgi:thiol-disulfide isomerase/thioredoxin